MSDQRARSVDFARVRPLLVALAAATIGIAGCGSDDADNEPAAGSTVTSSTPESSGAVPESEATSELPVLSGDPILIVNHVTGVNGGEVVQGSFIGDLAFCPGGTMHHEHGNPDDGTGIDVFECRDGSLSIGFTPVPPGFRQSSPWKVVSGTGSFDGARGQGWMAVKFAGGDSEEGKETFTGTVTR